MKAKVVNRVSFQILDAKKHRLRMKKFECLQKSRPHHEVMEWDVDVHTKDINEMRLLFKEFFKKLPENEDQIFLVGKLNGKIIGFLGIHRQSKRMSHVGVLGVTMHPDH